MASPKGSLFFKNKIGFQISKEDTKNILPIFYWKYLLLKQSVISFLNIKNRLFINFIIDLIFS